MIFFKYCERCESCGISFFSEERESECLMCESTNVREIKEAPRIPALRGKYVFEKEGYDTLELLGVVEHFNGSMWWLFENTGNNVYFYYARLSGMEEFAEFGYTCIDECPRTGQTDRENLLCIEPKKEENSILGSIENAVVRKCQVFCVFQIGRVMHEHSTTKDSLLIFCTPYGSR